MSPSLATFLTPTQLLGLLGATLVLAAYGLLTTRRLTGDGRLFHGLNLGGASLLCYVGLRDGSLGFSVLNLIWAVVALRGLMRVPRTKHGSASTTQRTDG